MGRTVGIDLASIEAVEESIRVHSDRYLGRVYTSTELDECRRRDGRYDAGRLATRMAAKEAVLKVLRVADESVPWSAIGVCSDESGRPAIELSGAAEELARARGIKSLEVSLTLADRYAAAVVVAEVHAEL